MPPRSFTNPAPKTESARTALTSFTCTLCNKSYSRHPEYEAHIGSYDHQHKKRLRDLKQLSRDPNAAERARRAERKADEEAGLVVVGSVAGGGGAAGKSGGFKKGGFKSSFAAVGGAGGTGAAGGGAGGVAKVRKNVLGDDEDEEGEGDGDVGGVSGKRKEGGDGLLTRKRVDEGAESDTDEEYGADDVAAGGGYYDPRRPTGCFSGCAGVVRAA
ncbi:hypothetical protein FQN55_000791 [Onygenales sp. PD_40]|nr:hypothetical protein FQN55_000791 [Onygenales sp. PD_40]